MNVVNRQPQVEVAESHQAKPLLIYTDLSMLTVKNPNNRLDKEDLLRVCHHLKSIIGFSTIYYEWYELGDQNQQHIHLIIKKKPPTDKEISLFSKSFKQKKLKYQRYYGEAEEHNSSGLGDFVEYEIDTSSCNWKITPFKDAGHLNRVIWEYRFKDLDPQFLD